MRTLINNALPVWLFLFCVLVFANGIGGDFVMDDWPVIADNSKITETKYIPDYFSRGVWANTDFAGQTGIGGHNLYRPIFLLTLNLGHHLWGNSTFGYHALDLVLHGINTILVFFLILGFLSPAQRMIAGMSAAIFAVHPVHVESVSWIAGITDPLVSVFLLGTFLLHRRSYQATSQSAKIFYAVSAPLCFALALLSKETAIFFPFVLLIYDALYQRKQLTIRTGLIRYASYAILLLIYFMLRSNALGGEDAAQASAFARINLGNFPVLLSFLAHYIQLLIFPSPLEYYYSPPATGWITLIFGGLCLIGALAYLPFALRRKQPLFVLAVSWIIITLLPALPIALIDEPVFALRVLYLPTVGFAMLIALCLYLAQRLTRPIEATIKTIAIAFLLFFSIASMSEIADWENDTRFYSQAMKTNSDSFKPVAGLAAAYARDPKKDPEAAIDLYLKAAKLASRESDKLDFWENAARLYGQNGETDKSEALYQDIVRRAPKRSSAWVGLGNNALAHGDQQQALQFYQKAYAADPNNRIASYNLALIYQRLGDLKRAAFYQRIAQQLQTTKK